MAEDAALDGVGLGEETGDVEGEALRGGGCATPSADRPTAKDDAGRNAGDFRLPPGLFVASELCHLDEVPAELGVPVFEQWK